MISLEEIHIAKCKKSFHYFVKWIWTLHNPGQTFYDAPYIKFICDHLQKRMEDMIAGIPRKGLILNLGPATSKSFICSLCAPLYLWVIYPCASVMCSSVNTVLALNFATSERDIINNPQFQKFFQISLREDQNSKNRFLNEHGGSRISFGIDTPSIGFHAMLQILDDVQSLNGIYSEVDRNKTNVTVTQHLASRTGNNPAAQQWVIMQRLSQQDLTGFLIPFDTHEVICLPAELNDQTTHPDLYQNNLLAPDLLSETRLKELRTKLGINAFEAQFNQRPGISDFSLIKPEQFVILDTIPHIRDNARLHIFCDLASSIKKSADFSAAIACFTQGNSLIVTNVFHFKYEYVQLRQELTAWIKQQFGYNRSTQIYIESASSGEAMLSDLKNDSLFNVNKIDKPKVGKEERAQGVSARIAAGRVKLLRAFWNANLINEACALSSHDDIFDALMHAIDTLLDERIEPASYKNRISFVGDQSNHKTSWAYKINQAQQYDNGNF